MSSEKSRHLSFTEYLDQLQKEYIVAELRKKIYRNEGDKKYYEHVMVGKKEKIISVSDRNSLPNIFTDESLKKNFYSEVYGNRFPNIEYPDYIKRFSYVKDGKTHYVSRYDMDVYYYYSRGEEVKVFVNNDDQFVIGMITSVLYDKKISFVKIKGEQEPKPFPLSIIVRIL